MPRGVKTCPKCKATTGPRSWNCPQCGHGYVVAGVQKPDMDAVTANPSRLNTVKADYKDRLWNLVELYEGDDDVRARKRYNMEGRTWQSKCGQYRIREQFTFMGVNMTAHFSKCVYLLKLRDNLWDVVRPKGHFRTPLAALRRMLKDTNGKKPKATTNRDRLRLRVSQMRNGNVVYDS